MNWKGSALSVGGPARLIVSPMAIQQAPLRPSGTSDRSVHPCHWRSLANVRGCPRIPDVVGLPGSASPARRISSTWQHFRCGLGRPERSGPTSRRLHGVKRPATTSTSNFVLRHERPRDLPLVGRTETSRVSPQLSEPGIRNGLGRSLHGVGQGIGSTLMTNGPASRDLSGRMVE